jgi:hypothetical protein
MRCLEPKLHWFMISECEYSSCWCMLSKSESLSLSLQSSSLQQKNNKKNNNQCPCMIFWFGITRYSILEFFVLGHVDEVFRVIFRFEITGCSILEFSVFGVRWYSMLLTSDVYPCPICHQYYCFLRWILFVCHWFRLVFYFW